MEGNAEQVTKATKRRASRAIARLLVALVVVFAAAWFVSNMTAGSVDFWRAVIVLVVFAVAEWYLRAWRTQSRE